MGVLPPYGQSKLTIGLFKNEHSGSRCVPIVLPIRWRGGKGGKSKYVKIMA
jgi:hypothetical protein